jgi:asparagine synthase (glutamine-hydrolysing)
MCGIAGVADFSGAPIDPSLLEAMADAVRHRGPDGHACWIDAGHGVSAGLAHCRLAVIDLSPAADQPMRHTGCAGAAAIVFNGEIYNYQSLRRELVERGHQFESHSDTEVILHLYE